MRTLHADLTTAQQASSGTPYPRVYLPDYSGGTDLTAYVKKVVQTEQCFGGMASVLLGDIGSWFISASAPIDFRGYRVDIGWGFNCAGDVDRYANAPPMWIKNTPLVSFEGEVGVQLECFDIWNLFLLLRVMNASTATAAPRWPGDTTIYDIIDGLVTAVGACSLVKDSSDGIIDVYMPYYESYMNQPVIRIIAEVMSMTNCYIRMANDGNLHVGKLAETSGTKYTFDISSPGHVWFTDTYEDELVLPNRAIAVDVEPKNAIGDEDAVTATYEGSAEDTNSKTLLQRITGFSGYVTRVIEDGNFSSNAEATRMAEAMLSGWQRSSSRGILVAPMECSIELWDWVEVVDSRWP